MEDKELVFVKYVRLLWCVFPMIKATEVPGIYNLTREGENAW